jgi:hypothetical protein
LKSFEVIFKPSLASLKGRILKLNLEIHVTIKLDPCE